MKKIYIFLAALMSAMCVSAQHVKPLNITIPEINVGALIAQYPDLNDYMAELQKLDAELGIVGNELKTAEKEYKDEQAHLKNVQAMVKQTQSAFKTLSSLYDKEQKELTKLNKNFAKQYDTSIKTSKVDYITRQKFLDILEIEKVNIENAEADAAKRKREVSNEGVKINKLQTETDAYATELTNKGAQLKALQTKYKETLKLLKDEIKITKGRLKNVGK